ncbi:MAG: 4Fe-4S dicluster domain-containing protein [Promethearchaeota archaeon]
MHGATTLSYCYQCATCTGGCPVARETNGKYNPRRIIERSLLGMKDKLVSDPIIWQCTVCDTCDESCPQNVMLTEIFTVIKNMAVRSGNVPEAIKLQSSALFDFGITIPYGDAILRRRRDMGLDEPTEIPLSELQSLMEATGFKEIVDGFKKKEGNESG